MADPEQLALLPTEARNPRSADLDQLSTLDMLSVINDEDAKLAAVVRAALPQIASAVDAISARFDQGGRLFYVGAGTSGRLGVLDASECPPTFSVSPSLFTGIIAGGDSALRNSSEQAEDSPERGAEDLDRHLLTARDSVLGIAASGRTPYVLGALTSANHAGALTVSLTCAAPALPAGLAEADAYAVKAQTKSPMASISQLAIELATGAEVLTGSTRMKAGTATKLVLNMISTAVMVRQGAVLGNLMVNVQPTNAKLADRGCRIIAAATGCSTERAAQLLRESGSVKIAIAMEKLGLPYAAASSRLKYMRGRLRSALDTTL